MKGKIAFVVGAAVGYVLGSRAGRERYEQIKRGAEAVWQTPPVQRAADAARDAIDGQTDNVKAFVRRATSNAFANLAKQTADEKPKPASKRSSAAKPTQAAKRTSSVEPASPAESAKPDNGGGRA